MATFSSLFPNLKGSSGLFIPNRDTPRHSRYWSLFIHGARPRISWDDIQLRRLVSRPPGLENQVNKAVMTVEDQIKACSVILTHDAVAAWHTLRSPGQIFNFK